MLQALFGAISDAAPLCGFYKSVYILLSSASGVAAFAVLSVVPLTSDEAPVAAVGCWWGSGAVVSHLMAVVRTCNGSIEPPNDQDAMKYVCVMSAQQ